MGCGASSSSAVTESQPGAKKIVDKEYSAPTGLISDVAFKLPAEDIQKSCGLALDIGSTLGKIVYRSNKDYKDCKPINPEVEGQAHYAIFPRGDIQGMIKYIKENCDLTKNEEGETMVYSSGIGGATFRVEIETGLNCKFVVVPESDCFCKGLFALEKILPEEELFIPHSQKVQEEAAKWKAQMEAIMPKMLETMENTKWGLEAEATMKKEEDRPRMMVMAGSGTGIFQINKDETCTMMSGLYTAGRFMYGLSSVLTGENDFNKLREMAETADGKTADTWMKDLTGDANAAGGDNMYEAMANMPDMMAFPFGKGVTIKSDDMKKEDKVYSVFNTTAIIHAQEINANAQIINAKAVYFAGNVFNSEIMRNMISSVKQQVTMMLPENQQYEYYFLKNGGMLGALGAFLQTKKKTDS